MRGKGVSKMAFFLIFFCLCFFLWNLDFWIVSFVCHSYVSNLGVLFHVSWSSLCVLWQPCWTSDAFLRVPLAKNIKNTLCFLGFCICRSLFFLLVLVLLYGLVLVLLGCSVFTMGSNLRSSRFLKTDHATYINSIWKCANLVMKMGSRNRVFWDRRLKALFTTAAFFWIFLSFFCMAFWRFLGCLWATVGLFVALLAILSTQKR